MSDKEKIEALRKLANTLAWDIHGMLLWAEKGNMEEVIAVARNSLDDCMKNSLLRGDDDA